MDPLTAVTTAQELASLFLLVVKQIRKLIETIKDAQKAFLELVRRSERMRLLLNEFKSLAQRLQNSPHEGVTLTFNGVECSDTIRQLQALVRKVSEEASIHQYWMRLNWVKHKGQAAQLLSRLDRHELELCSVLQFIAARSSTKTEQDIEQLRKQLESQPLLVDPLPPYRAYPDGSAAQLSAASAAVVEETHQKIPVNPKAPASSEKEGSSAAEAAPSLDLQWLGSSITEAYNEAYVKARATLANASYLGDWEKLLESVHVGAARFGEQWANAYRLKPLNEVYSQSMWTPLHQAAFMGAPEDVVRSLIRLGASRTLRTRTTDDFLPYNDMTASEIAGSLGYVHLEKLLAPSILHYLPSKTAVDLQEQLHKLLKQLLGDDVHRFCLRLPELSVLTELENPIMIIVLPNAARIQTISMYLDGRELLIRYEMNSEHHTSAQRQGSYRISTTGWEEIEHALSFLRRL